MICPIFAISDAASSVSWSFLVFRPMASSAFSLSLEGTSSSMTIVSVFALTCDAPAGTQHVPHSLALAGSSSTLCWRRWARSTLPARATVEEVRGATHAYPLVGLGSAVGAHSSWDRCPRLVLLTLCAMLRTSSTAAPPFLLRVPAIVAENSPEHVLGILRGPIFLRLCVCFSLRLA